MRQHLTTPAVAYAAKTPPNTSSNLNLDTSDTSLNTLNRLVEALEVPAKLLALLPDPNISPRASHELKNRVAAYCEIMLEYNVKCEFLKSTNLAQNSETDSNSPSSPSSQFSPFPPVENSSSSSSALAALLVRQPNTKRITEFIELLARLTSVQKTQLGIGYALDNPPSPTGGPNSRYSPESLKNYVPPTADTPLEPWGIDGPDELLNKPNDENDEDNNSNSENDPENDDDMIEVPIEDFDPNDPRNEITENGNRRSYDPFTDTRSVEKSMDDDAVDANEDEDEYDRNEVKRNIEYMRRITAEQIRDNVRKAQADEEKYTRRGQRPPFRDPFYARWLKQTPIERNEYVEKQVAFFMPTKRRVPRSQTIPAIHGIHACHTIPEKNLTQTLEKTLTQSQTMMDSSFRPENLHNFDSSHPSHSSHDSHATDTLNPENPAIPNDSPPVNCITTHEPPDSPPPDP